MSERGTKETKKKRVWKNVFIGRNPDTGVSYFERRRVTVKEPPDEGNKPTRNKLRPLSPQERGSYSADLVAEGMERREDAKERAMREAMGLPPEDED